MEAVRKGKVAKGKESSKFDPDFFIVNVAHGAPSDKKGHNILKTYDFPMESRQKNGVVTESMIKDYCDELVEEIKSLQEQLEDTKNENEELKQLLTDAGVEYD